MLHEDTSKVFKHSKTGIRPSNEDEEVIIHNLLPSHSTRCASYYAVFDGHGGKECAQFLKEHLHCYLAQYCADSFTDECICAAFEACDAAFYAEQPELAKHVGSAATVAIIECGELICCNVGDSRILLSNGGHALQLTNDHKASVPAEAQRIKANGGMVILGRVLGKLAISRAFGDFEFKDVVEELREQITGPLVICAPEITRRVLDSADEFLLLACDGLFEVFTSQGAVSFVKERLGDPQAVVQDLVHEAIQNRGSGDNVSAVLALLNTN